MARIKAYDLIQANALKDTDVLVLDDRDNPGSGTRTIKAKDLIVDISKCVKAIAYSGSNVDEYVDTTAIYFGWLSPGVVSAGYARIVCAQYGQSTGTTQTQYAFTTTEKILCRSRGRTSNFSIVSQLPTESIDTSRVYCVLDGSSYKKYKYKNSTWTLFGRESIPLGAQYVWNEWGSWKEYSTPVGDGSITFAKLSSSLQQTLNNIYSKQEVYTKSEVDTLIAGVSATSWKVVASLPTTDIQTNVVYLVEDGHGGYNQYVRVDNEWIPLGPTDIDLSEKVDITTEIARVEIGDGIGSRDLATGLGCSVVFVYDDSGDSILSGDSIVSLLQSLLETCNVNGDKASDNDLLFYSSGDGDKAILRCVYATPDVARFVPVVKNWGFLSNSAEVAGLNIGNGDATRVALQETLGFAMVYSMSGGIRDPYADLNDIPISSFWSESTHGRRPQVNDFLLFASSEDDQGAIEGNFLFVCTSISGNTATFESVDKASSVSIDGKVDKTLTIAGLTLEHDITDISMRRALGTGKMWLTGVLVTSEDEGYDIFYRVKITDLHDIDGTTVGAPHELWPTKGDFINSEINEGVFWVTGNTTTIDGELWEYVEPIYTVHNSEIQYDHLSPQVKGLIGNIHSKPIFSDVINKWTDPNTGVVTYVSQYALSEYFEPAFGSHVIFLRAFDHVQDGATYYRTQHWFLVYDVQVDVTNQKITSMKAMSIENDDGKAETIYISFERTPSTLDNDVVTFTVDDTVAVSESVVVKLTPVYVEGVIDHYTSDMTKDDAEECITEGKSVAFVAVEASSSNVYTKYFFAGNGTAYPAYDSFRFDCINISDIYDGIIYYATLEGMPGANDLMEFGVIEDSEIDLSSKADIENGNVSVNAPEYYPDTPSTPMMTGSYQIVGEYCTVTATAKMVASWVYVYYRLPVVPLSDVLVNIITNSTEYEIKTDVINSINCVNIYRKDGQAHASANNVSFTITYKCDENYSSGMYTQAEVDQMIANYDQEIERQLALL